MSAYTDQFWPGDNRVVLPTLPRASVQLIFTSPRYNVGWHYADHGQDDRTPLPDYLDGLLVPVLAECYRVLGSGGVLALNLPSSIRVYDGDGDGVPQRPTATLRGRGRSHKPDPSLLLHRAYPLAAWAQMHLLATGWLVREPVAWVKAHDDQSAYSTSTAIGGPRNPYLRPCHEMIVLASKGTYAMGVKDSKRWGGDASDFGRYLEWCKDVWHIRPGRAADGEPLAFPPALTLRVLELFSAPGDVVLDPFAGTGAVAALSRRLGRVAWAIERQPQYYANLEAIFGQGLLLPLDSA